MAITKWLIDKSAYQRLVSSSDAKMWAERIESGRVHLSTMTRLEIGVSFRSGNEARLGWSMPPLTSLILEYLTPAIENRAATVQLLLTDKGQHRAPSIPDLLIAATAELSGLTVLHVDKDFELIANITKQPVERLALT